jgi:hypothetical protein
VVESVLEGECTKCADSGTCVVDAFTMVNSSSNVRQLVPGILSSLGLGHLQTGARGKLFYLFISKHIF